MTRKLFGIGVYHPKYSVNIGTLWRHAFVYKADFIFTIGKRYKKQGSDTLGAVHQIPFWQFKTWEDFLNAPMYNVPLVGVELTEGAVALQDFNHPRSCMYLLGAEDHGLPNKVLDKVHTCIQIPSPSPLSLNVAVAGSIVMHDRYSQSQRDTK